MRPWLLLVPLLVSDLSLLGDGDWVMENYRRGLDKKLLLNGRMSPRGLKILQIQTEHDCMCIQRHCVYVAVQHKQRTSLFYWVYIVNDEHGCRLSHEEFPGIIHWNHFPALVVFLHEKGKRAPAFLPALHGISEITPTKLGAHIGINIIKKHHDSGTAWLLHHHMVTSGKSFKAFSLEKPKSWTSAIVVQPQKMLTKRCCAAKTVIISPNFKNSGIISALKIRKVSKKQIAPTEKTQKESKQRAMTAKVIVKYNGQKPSKASFSQIFPAASLSSSSLKTPHTSQLKIQRKAARIIKNREHINMIEASLLHESVQRQHPLKATSGLHDDDGFNVKRQLLFVSREKTESIKRPQYKMRAARDHNKEGFSGKIITGQADFERPQGESETEQSHTNIIENRNQERLAYIREADTADNNVVDHNRMLNEVGKEVLIMLFLPEAEMETKTEPLSDRNGWKRVKTPIKQLDDPSPMTEVIKANFIIETDNSKCNCLKERPFSLEIYAPYRIKKIDLKPAELAVKVTSEATQTEKQVTETKNKSHGNTSINHSKQEEIVPSEESVIPSPPALKMMETEPAKTTAVNMEIKEATSSTEVFTHGGTQMADEPPSTETQTTPTRPQSERSNNTQATTGKSFSGLRMREDVTADTTKDHDSSEDEETAATKRPETERKDGSSLIFAEPPPTIHQQATDQLPKTTDDNKPPCGGLIHRTEAGWKHCVERFAGTGSKMFSSTDAFRDTGEQRHTSPAEHKENPLHDDEYDHFYYFDGVMKRVQNNFYPYYKRQKWRRGSDEKTAKSVFTDTKTGDTHENLPSYIQRLAARNKASRFR